jgi:hypothetical protein
VLSRSVSAPGEPGYCTEAMNALRRTLYLQAAVWGAFGLALALVPRFVLVAVFDQARHEEYAWARLFGIHAVGLAMVMVLVAHRIQELWWWSWAFAFTTAITTAVVLLNAAFGLSTNQGAVLWWLFTVVALAFSLGLLYGLFVASREQPLP